MSDNKIGFVGIGNMGWPMAANLVRAGREVVVYDTNHAQVESFVDNFHCGAASGLEDLGKLVNAVITMLPAGKDVRRVMLEEQGGLAGYLDPASLLIDMSSSDPIGTRELGSILSEKGIQFVDAPVSGGVPGAENASLAIMIGSDDSHAVSRALPILSDLGKRLFETGPLGSGHAMKSLNNVVAGTGFIAITEALIVGRNFGLDPAVMIDILNSSTGRSFNSEHTFGDYVLNSTFASGFSLSLLSKDVKIASDLVQGLGLDAPVLKLASERWQEAAEGLGSGRDFTEAYAYWNSEIKPDKS